MKNTKLTLNEVTNVYDIINFIKGNTNNIYEVLEEIKRVCSDKVIVKPYHNEKNDTKTIFFLTYTNDGVSHEIICGSHYNPYPNVECYVL